MSAPAFGGEPAWYQDAILYELHVRAFHDSNGDGMGDFPGITAKLDYLKDLGVTAIWVLPFYPSPWRDDGYDISDYTSVHPAYGTLREFKVFLREAHRRGLRVITELVLNHTSDQHPWFQRARRSPPGSTHRDFYVWSDTPERYQDARIIFKDFEVSNWAWDAEARAYYWHRFYSHQPDLNFDNPAVRRAMMSVVDFWFDMGVDGLRLDAVPYLYEREGTTSENLPETHAFLQELRAHVDERYSDRMLLAEANQWPEDAVAYFGDGDECHMAFHFPVMPRMFMAIRMEDRFPLVDILQQTPAVPSNAAWALFLRNHDELTLEMVTDEERDYMYRVYAHDPQMRINLGIRRRLAPLLGNNRRQIELMNGLLFSLPGTPVIYYGDEIGMGDNIYLGDRNGVRTPMQWSSDRNAGFSRANPQRLFLPVIIDPEYHYEALNVEAQQNNPHSLLWWMRHLITLRTRNPALARGSIEFLFPENRKVLAFVRALDGHRILVVANLSRFAQAAELDLSEFRGATPVELFGGTEFPRIGELPYFLTLGPHSFYWFALQHQEAESIAAGTRRVPSVSVRDESLALTPDVLRRLEPVIPGFLRAQRWFGAKSQRMTSAAIVDTITVPMEGSQGVLAIVQANFVEGDPQTYVVPLAIETGERARLTLEDYPQIVVARIDDAAEPAIIYDALSDPAFARTLLGWIERRRRVRSTGGEVVATSTRALRAATQDADDLEPWLLRAEQSNTSVAFGDRLIMKLFRRVEEGINPDLQVGKFLTEERRFAHTPAIAGALEYRRGGGEPATLGLLQEYVVNEGDAWSYTVDQAENFIDRALARDDAPRRDQVDLLSLAAEDPPELAHETIGVYLESARLIGERTAELHWVLASGGEGTPFEAEPFTAFYRRSLYQSLRRLAQESFAAMRRRQDDIPAAAEALRYEQRVLQRFQVLFERNFGGMRTRTHGDYHLGQLLYTGKDFVIIDFEGEPSRPVGERRIKRSPLVDVAGMIRSFHYAAHAAAFRRAPEEEGALEGWIEYWYRNVAAVFLRSYLDCAKDGGFLPRDDEEIRLLLDLLLLEKAVYELGYEANNRPSWLPIPLRGIRALVDGED